MAIRDNIPVEGGPGFTSYFVGSDGDVAGLSSKLSLSSSNRSIQ